MPAARLLGRLLRCWLLGGLLTPCRGIASRCALRLLLGRLTAAPSWRVALRLRCGLLRRLTAPCPAALGLLRLLRGLLLTEAALGRLLLRLRSRCALPRLARFVAVNVEDLFNFGITLLRGFFALL